MVRKFEVRSIVSVLVEQVSFLKGLDVYLVTFVSGRLAGYDDGAVANVEGLIRCCLLLWSSAGFCRKQEYDRNMRLPESNVMIELNR